MDPAEPDHVFVCDSLDAARGWGSEIAGQYGQSFFVFEVAPEEPRPGAHGTYAAARARILALVFAWDAATETATFGGA